jgi:collagen type IX alpha
VVLYVDCEQTTTEFLEPRGPIDVNGDITISKLAGSRNTVPVCISFHCLKFTSGMVLHRRQEEYMTYRCQSVTSLQPG